MVSSVGLKRHWARGKNRTIESTAWMESPSSPDSRGQERWDAWLVNNGCRFQEHKLKKKNGLETLPMCFPLYLIASSRSAPFIRWQNFTASCKTLSSLPTVSFLILHHSTSNFIFKLDPKLNQIPASGLPGYHLTVLSCHAGHGNETSCFSLTFIFPKAISTTLSCVPILPLLPLKPWKWVGSPWGQRQVMQRELAGQKLKWEWETVLCLCKLTGKCFLTVVPGQEMFSQVSVLLKIVQNAMLE